MIHATCPDCHNCFFSSQLKKKQFSRTGHVHCVTKDITKYTWRLYRTLSLKSASWYIKKNWNKYITLKWILGCSKYFYYENKKYIMFRLLWRLHSMNMQQKYEPEFEYTRLTSPFHDLPQLVNFTKNVKYYWCSLFQLYQSKQLQFYYKDVTIILLHKYKKRKNCKFFRYIPFFFNYSK